MKELKVSEVSEAVNGRLSYKDEYDLENKIVGVSIDSRSNLLGHLFIPIKGEIFDGHDFIQDAIQNGAVCCISEFEFDADVPIIVVESAFEALKILAQYYRSLFDIPVIAVTGSNGKTTTKDLIASVLAQKYNVLKTQGNFNNEIGLPLTIFNLDDSYDCAVIEMGMNNLGEIHNLSKIAKPHIAVITNIGVAHIQNLGSKEIIKKAKFEIFDFLDKSGYAILNGDDSFLKNSSLPHKTLYFGLGSKNDIFADHIVNDDINSTGFLINYREKNIDIKLKVPGIHMVLNSLTAALVGFLLNLDTCQIKHGIESFELTKMRMDIIKLNKFTIINDVYNANPESVKASLDVLSNAKTRKVCIIGDMLELGSHSQKLHREIGQYIVDKEIDIVICVGKLARFLYDEIAKTYKENDSVFYFENQNDEMRYVETILEEHDTILVKASRGVKFEETVRYLNKILKDR